MNTRLKPEDLIGADPIRSWDKLYRASERPDASERDSPPDQSVPPGQPDPPEHEEPVKSESLSWDSIANEAIERGYQVIEEQIRQGEQVAKQMRSYKDDVQKANNDISRLVERSLGFYKDVGYLWFELVESFLRNPAVKDGQLYQAMNANAREPQDPSTTMSHVTRDMKGNAVEISVSGTRVRIDINEPVHDGLVVQPLHAIDESLPAINNIELCQSDGRPVLRVSIPPDQPEATYTGVIIDKRSKLPKGTVSVVIDRNEL